jgi:hypothetical protein
MGDQRAEDPVNVRGTINDPSDEDDGWSVEIAIPWPALNELSKLQLPPKPGEHIRINFSRVEWQTVVEDRKYVKVPNTPEDNWVWSPQLVVDMHQPERWGILEF